MTQTRTSLLWIVLLALLLVFVRFAVLPTFADNGNDSAEVADHDHGPRPSREPSETRSPHEDDEDRPTRNPSETRQPRPTQAVGTPSATRPHHEDDEDRPTRNPSETRQPRPTRSETREPRPTRSETREPRPTRTETREPRPTRTETRQPRPTPSGTRQPRPTMTVPAVGRAKGRIAAFPSELVGTWQVGGNSYTANDRTWFGQGKGAFAVGGCVELKYRLNEKTLISVESKEASACQS